MYSQGGPRSRQNTFGLTPCSSCKAEKLRRHAIFGPRLNPGRCLHEAGRITGCHCRSFCPRTGWNARYLTYGSLLQKVCVLAQLDCGWDDNPAKAMFVHLITRHSVRYLATCYCGRFGGVESERMVKRGEIFGHPANVGCTVLYKCLLNPLCHPSCIHHGSSL